MKRIVILLLEFCIASLIVSCSPAVSLERGENDSFQDMDLIYVSQFHYDSKSNDPITSLVFHNIDNGSKKQELLDFKFIKPANSFVPYLILGLGGNTTPSTLGFPAYIETNIGKNYTCQNLDHKFSGINSTQNKDNPYEVLLFSRTEILVFDLSTCSIVEVLKEETDFPSDGIIVGATFNRETSDLLYGFVRNQFESSVQYEIVQFNQVSGSERIITTGLNPSWSPDYSKFAFVRSDGIYLMEMKSGEITQIVERLMYLSDHPSSLDERIPTLAWSNDGTCLLYEYINTNLSYRTYDDYSIFLYQLVSQTEILISETGRYPAWLSFANEKQP